MQRKWTLSIFCGLAALLAGGAVTALAAGYGSAEDPLVTLSYITEVAAPEADSRIDSVFSEKQKALSGEIDEKIGQLRSEMEKQASQPAFSQQPVSGGHRRLRFYRFGNLRGFSQRRLYAAIGSVGEAL